MTSKTDKSPSWVVVVAVVAVAALGLVVGQLLFGGGGPRLYSGTVLQSDDAAPTMDGLVFARDGKPADIAAKDSDLLIVFFGYTNCPDVCPASMALAAQAVAAMDEGDQVRTDLWMVTVDPERDVPADLQQYVELFNPGFDGVTGPPEIIERVSTEYGVYYQADLSAESFDQYLVDHTSSLFGIEADGTLRIVWPPSITAEELQADIEALLS